MRRTDAPQFKWCKTFKSFKPFDRGRRRKIIAPGNTEPHS